MDTALPFKILENSHSFAESSGASLVELVEKVRGRGRPSLLELCEVAHDMGLLLPHVHRLLKLDAALEEENVNHLEVLDVALLFKLLADLLADQCRRHIQQVVVDNLRGLLVAVSV